MHIPARLSLIGLLFLTGLQSAFATTYTFIGNGNWSDALNWDMFGVPPSSVPSGDAVVIAGSGPCDLDVSVTLSSAASLTINSGNQLTVAFGISLQNDGSITNNGALYVNGTYEGSGGVAGSLEIGTGTFSPGNIGTVGCASIGGDLTLSGTTTIELSGDVACTSHDRITANNIFLGGTLEINLIGGYVPTMTTSFTVVTAATSISGTFTLNAPTTPGGIWTAATVGNDVVVTFTALAVCALPDVPTITASKSHSCVVGGTGETITLDVGSASLGDAIDWVWYEGSCGGTSIGTGTTLNVEVNATTTYYVRGEGGCAGTSAACGSIMITASNAPDVQGVYPGVPDLCGGQSTDFVVDIIDGTEPFTLEYNDGANQTVNNYMLYQTIAIAPTTTTTYSVVSLVDANGCADATIAASATLNVFAPYDITIAVTGPTSVCNGATTQVTVTSTGTATLDFQLDSSEGEGPSYSGVVQGTPINVTPPSGVASLTYYANMVYDANGCAPINVLGNAVVTQNTNPAYYVNAAATGSNNGLTWADAFTNLHDAFLAAASSVCPGITEIWVAAGTYKPSRDINNVINATNRNNTFKLPSNIAVYGGFPATGSPAFADRDVDANLTVLSGDIGTPGLTTDNVYHVVYAPKGGVNMLLDGFTITKGNANSNTAFDGLSGANQYGGGMLIGGQASGSASLTDCVFDANEANYGGALVHFPDASNPSATSLITSCDFTNNFSNLDGGAFMVKANSSGYSSSLSLLQCLFSANNTGGSGGAVYLDGSNSGSATFNAQNCIFNANTANSSGGGVSQSGGSGGTCTSTFTNCLFYQNEASSGAGGGLYCNTAPANMINCTFYDNQANASGAVHGFNANINVNSSIVWGNTLIDGITLSGITASGGSLTVTYTLTQDGTAGAGNLNTDPLFVTPGDPDGADNTWFTNDDGLRIMLFSPARNAANTTTPLEDLSNLDRVGTFDMGCYEYTECAFLGNATRLYVNSTLTGDGVGTTWATGYKSLANALQMATACKQVTEMWVAAGTYLPAWYDISCVGCATARDYTFQIPDDLALYGGFDNTGTATLLTQRNPTANPTILSGDIGVGGNQTDNCYHVVLMLNNTSSTIFDGFTVKDGVANGAGFISLGTTDVYQNNGGGIAMFNASPVVQNCVIENNDATSNGGGVYSTGDGDCTLIDDNLLNNDAGSFGGGMYIGGGAGITYDPVLTRCTFSGNSSVTHGGGLYIYASTFSYTAPRVTNCTFTGNSSSHGAAMSNVSEGYGVCAPGVINCVFASNSASFAAGGMANIASTSGTISPSVFNCIFYGNSAPNVGASMWNNGSGGGVSAPFVTNCTFVGNFSTFGVAGIHNQSGSPIVKNCIIWGNTSNGSHMFDDGSSSPTVTYSIVEGGYTGTGNTSTDPLFAYPVDPDGADNTWRTADDGLRLQAVSPAINAGDPSSSSPLLDMDILGVTRSGVFDLGAYDYNACAVLGASTRLYVNDAQAADGDGIAWLTAYKSLGNALKAAYDCPQVDEMWVAQGTYYPNRDTAWLVPANANTSTFRIPSQLAVYGGFDGTETTLGQKNPVTHPTILSGDLGVAADTSDNALHVVTFLSTAVGTLLDGFTIRDGNANITPHTTDSDGAGIMCAPLPAITHFSLSNCIIRNNYALRDGGGVFTNSGTSEITNCVFTENKAKGDYYAGAGLCLGGGIHTMTNCVLANNIAQHWSGAIGVYYATLNLANCTFFGNTAGNYSDDMFVWNSTLNATNCLIWGGENSNAHIEPSSIATVQHSITTDLFAGTANQSTDPRYTNAADPDGADDTWFTADDGLRIICGSPAENAGTATGTPIADILGTTANGIKDIGAYERTFTATPARLYVNQSGTGSEEGTSWATPFRELTTALACEALEPSVTEIWVAAGEYKPTTGTDRTATFALRSGLSLYGDFAGTESFLSQRVLNSPSLTVLSGDIGAAGDPADDVYHVVTASGSSITNSDSLNGFRIEHGNASGAGNDAKGGGMLIVNGAYPTVVGCTLDHNLAGDGAGVAIINPGVNAAQITELKDCTIINNTATNSGGGIYAEQMMVRFTGDTDISGNTHTGSCE